MNRLNLWFVKLKALHQISWADFTRFLASLVIPRPLWFRTHDRHRRARASSHTDSLVNLHLIRSRGFVFRYIFVVEHTLCHCAVHSHDVSFFDFRVVDLSIRQTASHGRQKLLGDFLINSQFLVMSLYLQPPAGLLIQEVLELTPLKSIDPNLRKKQLRYFPSGSILMVYVRMSKSKASEKLATETNRLAVLNWSKTIQDCS